MLAFLHALLKVNEDLKTIGALAGLAAVPGLGVLSLLYFGQAREVRRLREWAGRAPERAAELEARVTQEAQRRIQSPPTQPGPRPATAPATPAGKGNGVASTTPGQPATAAAQAAAGAAAGADAKPDGEKAGEEAKEGAAAEAKPDAEKAEDAKQAEGAKPGEKAKEGEEAKTADGAGKKADEADKPAVGAPAAAAATSAAPAASATAAPPQQPATGSSPPRTGPGTAAATAASSAVRPHSPAPPIPPRPPAPARATPAPSATLPPRNRVTGGAAALTDRLGRHGLLAVGAILLALIVTGVVIASVVGGGGGGKSTPPAPNSVGAAPAIKATGNGAAPAAAKAQRAQTSVAVLNGTTVTGLARSVANRLEEQGFTTVAVTDAANQTQSDTKVEFGNGHAAEARDVARTLKVPPAQVVPLTQIESDVAGPNAEVVVLVGQNFAR